MLKTKFIDRRIKRYAFLDISKIYHDLETSENGLSSAQIETKRKIFGSNCFDEQQHRDTMMYRLRRAFINPFHMILFVIGIISLITDVFLRSHYSKNATTTIIFFIMILISGIIRFIQELRAMNASMQLDRMIHETIKVKRDGKMITIPAKELVVGDVVFLSAGDRVPADLRLTDVHDLFISQAAITGESTILEKHAEKLKYNCDVNLMQIDNLAFMATTIISGQLEGIVIATGKDTLYGSFLSKDLNEKDDFQKGANSIAFVMLRFIAILIPIVFILLGITGGNWLESFTFALSVAVGLIPEMLPMVISACLARGSLIMSRKETIIKDINAMQGFGSMDVLCMDKTGTLTNENILLEYYMDVLGNESSEVLDYAYLNSYYHSGVRNPIDHAIVACESMPGKEKYFQDLIQNYQKTDEIPFDYSRKIVSTLVKNDDENILIVKGEVSHITKRCKYIEYRHQVMPMEEDKIESVNAIVDEMLKDGMKVIAIAKKNLSTKTHVEPSDEEDLILMGYLAFFDAPKKTVKASIEALQRLKVVPKILTGDQKDVAISVCRRVGISSHFIYTGAMIDELTDLQLADVVEQVHVFCELTPGQKYRIVDILKQNGHTVGFLGDGINDIPALSEANVGISVDNAVDAAKDAADVILLQKDLGVLEEAIVEGRKTFTNMLKYIKITASSNFGNILSIVCVSAFLPFLPMTAIQILLLNLLYDVLCIILPWDNVDIEDTLAPKDWSGKTLGRFMLSFGPISSIFDIATFLFLYFIVCPYFCGATYLEISDPSLQQQYIALFQTGWFLESMWTQVLILHFLRTRKIPLMQSRPSLPVICITLIGMIAFTAFTFPKGASFFGFMKLPSWYFIYLFIVVVLYMLFTTIIKTFYQSKYHELI